MVVTGHDGETTFSLYLTHQLCLSFPTRRSNDYRNIAKLGMQSPLSAVFLTISF